MDFDGLFWIALLVFYFLSRALGGGKKKKGQRPPQNRPARTPQQRQPPKRTPSHAQSSSDEDELADALDEIRRALGFPAAEPSTSRQPPEKETTPPPKPEVRQPVPLTTRFPSSRPTKRRTSPPLPRPESSTGSTPQIPVGAGIPDGPELSGSTPELHPVSSSFAEEDAFERLGRHDHVETRDVLKTVSPYDTPARRSRTLIQPGKMNRASLRDALVLKEVLDKPLALRRR